MDYVPSKADVVKYWGDEDYALCFTLLKEQIDENKQYPTQVKTVSVIDSEPPERVVFESIEIDGGADYGLLHNLLMAQYLSTGTHFDISFKNDAIPPHSHNIQHFYFNSENYVPSVECTLAFLAGHSSAAQFNLILLHLLHGRHQIVSSLCEAIIVETSYWSQLDLVLGIHLCYIFLYVQVKNCTFSHPKIPVAFSLLDKHISANIETPKYLDKTFWTQEMYWFTALKTQFSILRGKGAQSKRDLTTLQNILNALRETSPQNAIDALAMVRHIVRAKYMSLFSDTEPLNSTVMAEDMFATNLALSPKFSKQFPHIFENNLGLQHLVKGQLALASHYFSLSLEEEVQQTHPLILPSDYHIDVLYNAGVTFATNSNWFEAACSFQVLSFEPRMQGNPLFCYRYAESIVQLHETKKQEIVHAHVKSSLSPQVHLGMIILPEKLYLQSEDLELATHYLNTVLLLITKYGQPVEGYGDPCISAKRLFSVHIQALILLSYISLEKRAYAIARHYSESASQLLQSEGDSWLQGEQRAMYAYTIAMYYAEAQLQLGQTPLSLEGLRTALKQAETGNQAVYAVHLNMAIAHIARGELEAAVVAFDKVLALNQTDIHVILLGIYLCLKNGHRERAQELIYHYLAQQQF